MASGMGCGIQDGDRVGGWRYCWGFLLLRGKIARCRSRYARVFESQEIYGVFVLAKDILLILEWAVVLE